MRNALLTRSAASGLALGLAAGCAYSNVHRDVDRQPVVTTGVGATVLMPGAGAPALHPTPGSAPPGTAPYAGAPAYGAPGAAPAPGAPAGSYGAPAPGAVPSAPTVPPRGVPGALQPAGTGGDVSFIGGATVDEKTHREFHQDPLLIKALFAPLAVVALPFQKAYELVRGDPKPVIAPEAAPPPPPSPPDMDTAYEQARLRALERELARREGSAPSATPAPEAPFATTRAASPPRTIAEELALLRQQVPPRGPGVPGGAEPTPPGERRAVADFVGDRDRDGRPDHWQYRDDGVLVRELFDENGDGRVDRTVHYDTARAEPSRMEEDADFDGRVDSWVEYREGQISRRRSDGDGDGQADVWTFYRDGAIQRHEEDRDGDGFRDRVSLYSGGRLVREREDRSGDGRPDVVSYYDESEQLVRRDEDRDGNGLIDVRSHYEGGRLARREILDEAAAAESIEEVELQSAEWFGEGPAEGPETR